MSGTPLLLLSSAADWEEFQGDISAKYRAGDREIAWTESSAPSSYPCLVSAVWVESSVVCLFVYPKDVEDLMGAVTGATGKRVKVEPSLSSNVLSSALPDGLSQEGLWNRHMVALFLSVIHEMVSVGITKEERFESVLAGMIAVVDDKHISDIAAVRELLKRQFNPDDKGPPA